MFFIVLYDLYFLLPHIFLKFCGAVCNFILKQISVYYLAVDNSNVYYHNGRFTLQGIVSTRQYEI